MRKNYLAEEDREWAAKEIEFSRRAGWKTGRIYHTNELSGSAGAHFTLFVADGTGNDEIEKAMRYLRSEQDVTGFTVFIVPPSMVADDERDKRLSDNERIAKIREIVTTSSFNKVEGVAIDTYSASAIINLYDALSDANKAKYAAMPIPLMADLAFKLLNDQRKGEV